MKLGRMPIEIGVGMTEINRASLGQLLLELPEEYDAVIEILWMWDKGPIVHHIRGYPGCGIALREVERKRYRPFISYANSKLDTANSGVDFVA